MRSDSEHNEALIGRDIRVPRKQRVLVFIVAYNAERKIDKVIARIPPSLAEYDTEILIIDDSSKDRTFEAARRIAK